MVGMGTRGGRTQEGDESVARRTRIIPPGPEQDDVGATLHVSIARALLLIEHSSDLD